MVNKSIGEVDFLGSGGSGEVEGFPGMMESQFSASKSGSTCDGGMREEIAESKDAGSSWIFILYRF
jgi:hypothetical protein